MFSYARTYRVAHVGGVRCARGERDYASLCLLHNRFVRESRPSVLENLTFRKFDHRWEGFFFYDDDGTMVKESGSFDFWLRF